MSHSTLAYPSSSQDTVARGGGPVAWAPYGNLGVFDDAGFADSGHDFPVSLDLDTFIKWTWRVKKWHITATARITGNDNTLSDDMQMTDSSAVAITEELEIMSKLAAPYTSQSFLWAELLRARNGSGAGTGAYETRYNFTTKKYRPALHILFRFVGTRKFATNSSEFSTAYSIPETLSIDGIAVPLFTNSNAVGWYDSFSGNVEPIEFWPYENRLGQPVFDTSTGVQINDPFA